MPAPRNPYHHLVKHYHDGGLKKVQLNDPQLDSVLALQLLGDQYEALRAVQDADADLLLAWHWLTTREGALAGRTRPDEEGRLSLCAVGGDDDQNIYAFAGASVEFIRRFEEDYAARPAYLTDNYRSTAHIIAAARILTRRVAYTTSG